MDMPVILSKVKNHELSLWDSNDNRFQRGFLQHNKQKYLIRVISATFWKKETSSVSHSHNFWEFIISDMSSQQEARTAMESCIKKTPKYSFQRVKFSMKSRYEADIGIQEDTFLFTNCCLQNCRIVKARWGTTWRKRWGRDIPNHNCEIVIDRMAVLL